MCCLTCWCGVTSSDPARVSGRGGKRQYENRPPVRRLLDAGKSARSAFFYFHQTHGQRLNRDGRKAISVHGRRLDALSLAAPMLRIAHSMNRRFCTNLYYNRCCRFSTFFLLFFCCSNLNPTFTGNRYNVECAQVKHGGGSA